MTLTDVSVTKSVTVDAPIEKAFDVFTNGIGTWWPSEHHILQAELAEMVFEPRVGGHVYDRGVDGSECHWARVLAYDPPNRVVFSWDINPRWELEADPEKTSEIEVRFRSQGPDQTRVDLEHRNLSRHGEGWEAMRAAVDEGGWQRVLEAFAEVVRR